MNGPKGHSLEEAIESYKTVGYRNADFLFHWISDIYDFFYFPLIDLDYKDVLVPDKIMVVDNKSITDAVATAPEMDGLEVLRGIKSRIVSYGKWAVSNSCHLHLKTMPLEKKLGEMKIGSGKITAHLDFGRRMQRTGKVRGFKSHVPY